MHSSTKHNPFKKTELKKLKKKKKKKKKEGNYITVMIQNLIQNSINIIRKILMHSSKYITDLDSHNTIKYAIQTQSKNKNNEKHRNQRCKKYPFQAILISSWLFAMLTASHIH